MPIKKTSKKKPKRRKKLVALDMSFDEAMNRIVKVKPEQLKK